MNFAVFAKDGCPHCDKIEQVLELTGSKFVVYTLGQHFDKDAFHAGRSYWKGIIDINSESIGIDRKSVV